MEGLPTPRGGPQIRPGLLDKRKTFLLPAIDLRVLGISANNLSTIPATLSGLNFLDIRKKTTVGLRKLFLLAECRNWDLRNTKQERYSLDRWLRVLHSSPLSLLKFKNKYFLTLNYFPREINAILGMLAGVINHTVVTLMRRQESYSEDRVHSSFRHQFHPLCFCPFL